jgi:pimeloyl-ACP methyl ester carboxylesterase
MKNLRKYGKLPESGLIDEGSIRPFKVAVIHGGEELRRKPFIKPLRVNSRINSIKGQLSELKRVLKKNSEIPIILIGHSWGAWLCYIFAARYPSMVKKLILVSSGPFEQKYVKKLQANRLSHLNQKERAEYNSIIKILDNPKVKDKNKSLERLGSLTSKTDSYDPIPDESKKSDLINVQGDIFYRVWNEADELRKSGKLLTLSKDIR